MGGGAYLTNRNINNSLALKNQQEQKVDPIQSAINGVTSTAPVSLGVDSLDQAITPLDSSRTTSQLFSDYGAAPQQETAVTAVPTQATADLVAPTYNPKDILKQANGLMDVDLANDLNGDGRITSADALIAAKTQNITTPTAQQETTEPVVAPTSWSNGGPPNLNAEGIDLNKKIATNSYGGALKYSQLPPEDQAVVDARRASEQTSSYTPYKGATALMNEVNYGVGQQYDSPEEALSAFPSFLSSLKEKRVATDAEFNLTRYDPSEFTMAGVSPAGGVSKRAAQESTVDYLTKNNIPMFKVVDGQTRYLTTGLGSDVLYDILGEETLNKTNGDKGGSYQDTGPIGTYSTIHVDPESPLNNPILNVLGAVVPPLGLAITGVKAVTGETLHAGDWLKLANAGLEQAGAIEPPSAGAGGMGPVDNGVGLFDTTYEQTQNIMEAAAAAGSDGNPAEILIKGFGVTDDALASIGLDEAAFDDSIVDYTGFVEGVEQAASQVANGDSIEDAIKGGVLDYVIESESDIDLGIVTDAIDAVGGFLDDNIFQPILETIEAVDLGSIEDTVRDLGREFDDEVLQEIKGGIEEFAPQVEDFVKTVGGGVVDVAETVGGAAVDVVETVGGAAVDVVETVGGGVADALEPIGTAITDIAKVTGSTVGDVLEGVGDIAGDLSDEIGEAIKAGGDALEDFITPIGETIEDIAKATGSTVEDVLKGVASVGEDIIGEVGDVGQDVIDALEPIGETIEDIAKATGSTVEDVLKGVASVGEDILGGVGDVGQEVIDALGPLGSTLEDFAKATGKTLEEVVSELGGLGEDILGGVGDVGQDVIDTVRASGLSTEGLLQAGLSGLASQQAAEAAAARNLALATRTTDSLFSEFKGFKTKIGGTPIELVELIQRNRA